MTNEVINIIKRRRSVRVFKPMQITDDEAMLIADAGRYAPSGGASESRIFTVIQNKNVLERLNTIAKQYAAKSDLLWLANLGTDESFHSTYNAPTVILVSDNSQNICAQSDTSAATENILLAAESLNIGSCWGYFVTQAFLTKEGEMLKEELKIPKEYRVYSSVMLGYKDLETPNATERKEVITYIK